jgi:cell wall-associated NlpC family hydrolase
MAMAMAALGLVPCAAASAATAGGAGYGSSATTSSTPTMPSATTVTPTGDGVVTGGQVFGAPDPKATPSVPGLVAQVLANGTAAAPALAPPAVQQAIWAANQIVGRPYVRGGGHRSFRIRSKGYDCSGTVSYALHGGDLLDGPLDSVAFMKWGAKGAGSWITVYTARSHAYVVIAGLRLDTSAAGDPSNAKGPRWRPLRRSNAGYKSRHPLGL